MAPPTGAHWSGEIDAAAWIAPRLLPFTEHRVGSVLPTGFPAYCRILHPAEFPRAGHGRLVRWAEVARWSGRPLEPDAQFHSVALPGHDPGRPAPWAGQGPCPGSLYAPDARALADLLAPATGTPENCFFCLWDGYGFGGDLAGSPRDPARRKQRMVHLPNRDYLLWNGPLSSVLAAAAAGSGDQSPNLWWPADRAWCVATEIDLPWSYVGGSADLVEQIVADERIEALPARVGDSLARREPFVDALAATALTALLDRGEAEIDIGIATVRARLERAGSEPRAALVVTAAGERGRGSRSQRELAAADEAAFRALLADELAAAIVSFAGG